MGRRPPLPPLPWIRPARTVSQVIKFFCFQIIFGQNDTLHIEPSYHLTAKKYKYFKVQQISEMPKSHIKICIAGYVYDGLSSKITLPFVTCDSVMDLRYRVIFTIFTLVIIINLNLALLSVSLRETFL
jgi:hypothetical protein